MKHASVSRFLKLLAVPVVSAFFAAFAGCASPLPPKPGSEAYIRGVTGAVDDRRLVHANEYPGDWLTHGRTYAETRYSPLNRITTDNVDELGLVWSYGMGTHRGVEATPLEVGGILYVTGPWSIVYALDTRTGELIWSWDPQVPPRYDEIACCDVVNRGVALYKGKVYVGTLDGRLAALDAATGTPVWVTTTVDTSKAYTITGAPRVVDGKVIIGNGGAEYGVRGYVSAYDAETGALVWRTYTVPGNPAKGFASEAMAKAAETWTGEWWRYGGGGTVWDAMAYDPELDLLYVGTGNGGPWNRHIRSPGGGDNLYLSSILALDPDSGEIVWYYQTTPGDSWDFTATQHMILADLKIDGRTRRVLMQAPKNGFFYVLDRATGELISAEPYVPINWASGIDPETGRPIERPGADYEEVPYRIAPSFFGGHNWQPMAYSPQTGLVYIPAILVENTFSQPDSFAYTLRMFSPGVEYKVHAKEGAGALLAWDPVRQREVWRVPYASPYNGGVLTTAGGLVFQGTGDGRFVAYDARTGEKRWEAFVGTGVIAAPITYLVDGVQYVTIAVGWGGAWGASIRPEGAAAGNAYFNRVYTFGLGGDAPFPKFEGVEEAPGASDAE